MFPTVEWLVVDDNDGFESADVEAALKGCCCGGGGGVGVITDKGWLGSSSAFRTKLVVNRETWSTVSIV